MNEQLAFLRDLRDRLMDMPVRYGVDQGDVDQLTVITDQIESGGFEATDAVSESRRRRFEKLYVDRKLVSQGFVDALTSYVANEEWDLAANLCGSGASHFARLRDACNRMADLD